MAKGKQPEGGGLEDWRIDHRDTEVTEKTQVFLSVLSVPLWLKSGAYFSSLILTRL